MLKTDNKSTFNVAYGVHLLYRAGLPDGLVQLVCGAGPDIGPAIVDNADFVMFTGSTATGRLIGARAGQNLIGCTLELGGKNPLIVLQDADMQDTINGAIFAAFLNAGQACMHIERIYVPESRRQEFTTKFVEAARDISIGASYDFGPLMGSLVSVDHKDRVESHVNDAIAKGATVLTGGKARPDLGPAFFEPTVLTDVTPEMTHATVETFGSVATIYGYTDVEDSIARANDTDYGLNASVWGKDLGAAEAVGRRIEAGNVNINDRSRGVIREQEKHLRRFQDLWCRHSSRGSRSAQVHRCAKRRRPEEASPFQPRGHRLEHQSRADRQGPALHAQVRHPLTLALPTCIDGRRFGQTTVAKSAGAPPSRGGASYPAVNELSIASASDPLTDLFANAAGGRRNRRQFQWLEPSPLM